MSVHRLPSLTALFPVHNEEANVVAAASAILRVLPAVTDRWELVIVDDGSEDLTGVLADRLADSDPTVRVVHHPLNRGYGAAVRSGLEAAQHEYFFVTDGDQQFDPAQIQRLLARLGDVDVVVGYRCRRADHSLRRLNTWAWNRLVRAIFRLPVRDVNCAFKLLHRDVLAGIALRADGAMVSTEILAIAIRRGYRIAEVPVDHFPRSHGVASGANVPVIARAFVELVWLAGSLRRAPGGEKRRSASQASMSAGVGDGVTLATGECRIGPSPR